MYKILTTSLLLTAFAGAYAQQSGRPSETGQSVRERVFKDYKPAPAAPAPKPKEAFITSREALRQHIFPGTNGTGGGIPRPAATGARRVPANSSSTAQLPSNMTAAEAAQKAKTDAAAKPVDPAAQGKEPSLHYEKPKATTPKN